MTVSEVARDLRIHPVTVLKIKNGELDAVRLAGGRKLRVPLEAVDALLTSSSGKAGSSSPWPKEASRGTQSSSVR
jgi:excisionase family DNA binding protein